MAMTRCLLLCSPGALSAGADADRRAAEEGLGAAGQGGELVIGPVEVTGEDAGDLVLNAAPAVEDGVEHHADALVHDLDVGDAGNSGKSSCEIVSLGLEGVAPVVHDRSR